MIIVPDVHCRDFYKPVLNIKDKPVIFLGDYLDPYYWEGFSFEHGLDNLKEIIQFKKDNLDRVTLLIGNHDFNSLWQENWASRFTRSREAYNLYKENLNLFDPYKIIDNVFFTHAGVSKGWYDDCKIENIENFINKEWNDFLLNPEDEHNWNLFACGRSRGGWSSYGGIFWHDAFESYEFNPIDYVQIYGHTQLKDTGKIAQFNMEGKPMYCVDSRAIFEYYPETKIISRWQEGNLEKND